MQLACEASWIASLAWAHRCLAAYGRVPKPLTPSLTALYGENRSFENLLTLAWVILALNGEANATAETAKDDATR